MIFIKKNLLDHLYLNNMHVHLCICACKDFKVFNFHFPLIIYWNILKNINLNLHQLYPCFFLFYSEKYHFYYFLNFFFNWRYKNNTKTIKTVEIEFQKILSMRKVFICVELSLLSIILCARPEKSRVRKYLLFVIYKEKCLYYDLDKHRRHELIKACIKKSWLQYDE